MWQAYERDCNGSMLGAELDKGHRLHDGLPTPTMSGNIVQNNGTMNWLATFVKVLIIVTLNLSCSFNIVPNSRTVSLLTSFRQPLWQLLRPGPPNGGNNAQNSRIGSWLAKSMKMLIVTLNFPWALVLLCFLVFVNHWWLSGTSFWIRGVNCRKIGFRQLLRQLLCPGPPIGGKSKQNSRIVSWLTKSMKMLIVTLNLPLACVLLFLLLCFAMDGWAGAFFGSEELAVGKLGSDSYSDSYSAPARRLAATTYKTVE